MTTLTDAVFGQMTYDLFWSRDIDLDWMGSKLTVKVIVYSANGKEPSDEQKDCYAEFVHNQAALLKTGIEELLSFCQKNYNGKLTEKEMLSKITPRELIFRRTGRWGMTFDNPWENECRIAFVCKGKEATMTAGLDDLLI